MAKFDFNKPVASFSWYLQNGSADDKRGNRLHVGTGQKAQIYFDPESGEFARLLEYKCAERGRTLVRVGRFYPSSKTCSGCGHRLDALPLSVRSWDCPACGAHHDRDVNAARNILAEGKRILSNTEGTAGHAGTVAATVA